MTEIKINLYQNDGSWLDGALVQVDNDPKHTAKATQEFLKVKKWIIMQWPSQSPYISSIDLSVNSAPPLVTVAPSDKQTQFLTVLQWRLQCENLVPWCFWTQKATKWELNIPCRDLSKYLQINTVRNSKWGFTDLNASGRSFILRSVITIAEDNMQDQHCLCITGYD